MTNWFSKNHSFLLFATQELGNKDIFILLKKEYGKR